MKVYLAVPLVANRALGRAEVMARAIRESGNELVSPWVLGVPEGPDPSRVNVFERDSGGARSCDVIVADVSSPSTGVGMEVMAAHTAGRRIVLVWKTGSVVSNMLRHMRDKEVIEFEGDEDLFNALRSTLAAIRPGSSRQPI